METRRPGLAIRLVFTLTTLLSALLLFSIQPLFAKMVLPLLGGAPPSGPWRCCSSKARFGRLRLCALACQQGALASDRLRASRVHGAGVPRPPYRHSGRLDRAAAGVIPISGSSDCFAVAIGLPFVAVPANAPLLQAWFARATRQSGANPYVLYAASNFGSLVALLSYPFVLEPVFGLRTLASIWTAGFVLLLAALGVCFWFMRRETGSEATLGPETTEIEETRCTGHARPRLMGVPRVRAVRAVDGIHDPRRDRYRLGTPDLGAAAVALSLDLRHRLPRTRANPAAACFSCFIWRPCSSRFSTTRPDRARYMVLCRGLRRGCVLHRRARRPPDALRSATLGTLPHRNSICGCRSGAYWAACSRR